MANVDRQDGVLAQVEWWVQQVFRRKLEWWSTSRWAANQPTRANTSLCVAHFLHSEPPNGVQPTKLQREREREREREKREREREREREGGRERESGRDKELNAEVLCFSWKYVKPFLMCEVFLPYPFRMAGHFGEVSIHALHDDAIGCRHAASRAHPKLVACDAFFTSHVTPKGEQFSVREDCSEFSRKWATKRQHSTANLIYART